MDHIMSDENLDLCIRACRPQFPASAHLLRRQAEEINALRARLAAAEAERDNLTAKLALGWMDAGHCCCDRPGDDNTDRQVCAYHGRKLDELADAKTRAARFEDLLREHYELARNRCMVVFTGIGNPPCGECLACRTRAALRGEEVKGE